MPSELSSVAIITSAQPAMAALPAKQYPPTIAIRGIFPLNRAKENQVGRSRPPV